MNIYNLKELALRLTRNKHETEKFQIIWPMLFSVWQYFLESTSFFFSLVDLNREQNDSISFIWRFTNKILHTIHRVWFTVSQYRIHDSGFTVSDSCPILRNNEYRKTADDFNRNHYFPINRRTAVFWHSARFL